MNPEPLSRKHRVLIVDDEDIVLRAHARILVSSGYEVETAVNGIDAAGLLDRSSFDAIVSDINMPGMDGLQLLERVRTRDLDVPVVLVTGSPTLDSAIRAMEHGALRYLLKPVEAHALAKVVGDAVRLHEIAKAKRQALEFAGGVDRFFGDRAGLAASFDRAMDGFHIAYQPIIAWGAKTTYAYEALLRSREPSLPHPGAVLDAAERLGRVHELGRAIRAKAIRPDPPLPSGALLFLNLHPADLLDDDLFRSDGSLAGMAELVVLEITERASLDEVRDLRARLASLRELGFRIALDDLGAGYAGLTSFALMEPEVVKLDMALVRDIDREPRKESLVRTMITMCSELGIVVTAEGIETAAERDILTRSGCDLLQGYLFARPGPAFPSPEF